MYIRVLGAAAGGGYPQWNCNHPNSRLARNKSPEAIARTQSSIAISMDKKRWFIFNASPDLRQQLWSNPELMPSVEDPLRYSPIMGVLLTNADVELDDIATKALESYEELMRLGMNVQDVHAGRIFDNAANMLKVALDSKSTKIDKKLKMVDLQLKRQKLDQDLDPDQANNPNQQIFNRNDLLKFINKDDK